MTSGLTSVGQKDKVRAMYQVINQGKVVKVFRYFFDAWLCVVVDYSSCYSLICGPDGEWTINPQNN